jgi:hypothetical protein
MRLVRRQSALSEGGHDNVSVVVAEVVTEVETRGACALRVTAHLADHVSMTGCTIEIHGPPGTVTSRIRGQMTAAHAAVLEAELELPFPNGCEARLNGERSYPISDEELTALALSDDPNAPLPPDAVPLDSYLARGEGPLPAWYMPPVVTAGRNGRSRRMVVLALIAAFVLIEAFGLCSTYGQMPFH